MNRDDTGISDCKQFETNDYESLKSIAESRSSVRHPQGMSYYHFVMTGRGRVCTPFKLTAESHTSVRLPLRGAVTVR